MSEPTSLDLRGLKCPLPALRTRRALRAMAPGAELVVSCTDPLADIDIPHMAREEGHVVVGIAKEGAVTSFHLVRGATSGP